MRTYLVVMACSFVCLAGSMYAAEPFAVPNLDTPILGVTIATPDKWDESIKCLARPTTGVFVKATESGSPAHIKDGLSYGDVISRVNGKKISTVEEFQVAVQQSEVGRDIRIELRAMERHKTEPAYFWKQPRTIKLKPVKWGDYCASQCGPSENDPTIYELKESFEYPFIKVNFQVTDGKPGQLFWSAGISSDVGVATETMTVSVGGATYEIQQRSERDVRTTPNGIRVYERLQGTADMDTKRMLWDLAFGHGPGSMKWQGNLSKGFEIRDYNRSQIRKVVMAYLQLGGEPLN